MKRILCASLILNLVFFIAIPFAQTTSDADLVRRGDDLFRQRADLTKCMQALDFFKQALQQNPGNFGAAWKLSYAYYWIGEALKEKKDKIAAYDHAMAAAEQAVAANPRAPEGYFFRGLARVSKLAVTKNIFTVSDVEKDMAKVIEIDPAYGGGGAYCVLGRLYHIMPAILGGTSQKSIDNLRKAVQVGPTHWLNHLYLAEALLEEGQDEEARKLLQQVVAGSPPPDQEPEFMEWKVKAEKHLRTLSEGHRPASPTVSADEFSKEK